MDDQAAKRKMSQYLKQAVHDTLKQPVEHVRDETLSTSNIDNIRRKYMGITNPRGCKKRDNC